MYSLQQLSVIELVLHILVRHFTSSFKVTACCNSEAVGHSLTRLAQLRQDALQRVALSESNNVVAGRGTGRFQCPGRTG